jgi:hypothetical protein
VTKIANAVVTARVLGEGFEIMMVFWVVGRVGCLLEKKGRGPLLNAPDRLLD